MLVTCRSIPTIRLIRYLIQLVNDGRVGKKRILLDFNAIPHVDLEVKFGYQLILTTDEIFYYIDDGQFAVRVFLEMQKRNIRDKVRLEDPLVGFSLSRFQIEGVLKIISVVETQIGEALLFRLHA